MKQLQKQAEVQFLKERELTKLPFRLSNLQFFSDPVIPADETLQNEQTSPADDIKDSLVEEQKEPPVGEQKEPKLDDATKTFIEKMVQSAEDRVRSKYSKELNATKKELENYKTASMTAQEKAEYEMKQLQEQLEERERVLHQKE
ncbi:ribonuclease, partial [Bacillus cereus]